jgi:hypothetical protein
MTVLSFVYERLMPIMVRLNCEASRPAETTMGLFRSSRTITVDARQCTKAETIAADLGFSNTKPGDWVIRGEDGESYILNNESFQRTFAPVKEQRLTREARGAPKQGHEASSKTPPNPSGLRTGRRVRVDRTRGLVRPARKLILPIRSIHQRRGLSRRSDSFAHAGFATQRDTKVNQSI